jgi:hypothetical protein
MIGFEDFSMLAWNVRGFANRKSHCHMREILVRFKPDLIVLSETHTAFDSSKRFWEKEGYMKVEVMEATGHSGGLWVLYNISCPYSFTLMESVSQCITIQITRGNVSWVCSGIYASPTTSVREGLWDYLCGLRTRVMQPWILVGDFNDILLISEQRGGHFSQPRADKFADMIANCNLLVLDSFGSKFTWQARCRGNRLVSRRLDRGLCDIEWRMRFPEATVEHLVRRQSDHNPLLLRCCTGVSSSVGRPFRFQAAWCTHDDYHEIVKQALEEGYM